MVNLLGSIGRRVLPHAVARHAHKKGWLDLKLGFALLRDKRVSVLAKLASIATGAALTAIFIALEVPLETIVGALLPFVGLFFDLAIDGIEVLILPIVIGSFVLQKLAPKNIVRELALIPGT